MWTEGLACLSLYDRKDGGGTIMTGGLMMIQPQYWAGRCYVFREGTMGMQVTRDHSQPDTTITGPAGRQRAKAFHTPPNMAFTPLLQDTPEL